jgi:hypothetical protein
MGNVIGNNPESWAKNQVELRQYLLGQNPKKVETINWLTSNVPWIRVSSAVNISPPYEVDTRGDDGNLTKRIIEKTKILGIPEDYVNRKLAREYVLFNGVSKAEEKPSTFPSGEASTFIRGIQKGGVSPTYDFTNFSSQYSYGFNSTSNQGLVPMPGISNLSVSNLNRGSLRKVELRIRANNREQFTIIESIYMRPGYTILIEWGNSIYFKGTPDNYQYTNSSFSTLPFNYLMSDFKKEQDTLLSLIKEERRNSEGNYDGFFGKVNNFKWEVDEGGGYDITIFAVSIGEIMESLTINRTLNPTLLTSEGEIQIQKDPKAYEPLQRQVSGNPEYPGKTITVNVPNGYVRTLPKPNAYTKNTWDGKTLHQRVFYKEYINNPAEEPEQWEKDYVKYNGTDANGNVISSKNTYINFTLRPAPPTLVREEEEVVENILQIEADKSLFNQYLFKCHTQLKNGVGKSTTKIPTTRFPNGQGTSPTIKTYHFSDINDVSTTEFKGKDFLAVQPLVELGIVQEETGKTVKKTSALSQQAQTQYITLESLFGFMESNLLIYNTNADKVVSPYLTFDKDDETYCYTLPEQLSIDPQICLIPFTTKNDKGEIDAYYWYDVLGDAFRNTGSDYVGKLLKIHVNLAFIARCLEDSKEGEGTGLLKFLNSLLQGIQEALGNINQFTVTYDHDTNKIKITDDIPLDSKLFPNQVKDDGKVTFEVNGYKKNTESEYPVGSFVSKVGISTTITADFATKLALGAQSRGTSDIQNSSLFVRFNEGLEDSIIQSKLSKAIALESKPVPPTAQTGSASGLYSVGSDPSSVFKFNKDQLLKDGNVIKRFYRDGYLSSSNVIEAAKFVYSDIVKYQSTYYSQTKNVPSSQGFIPFNMNLDIEGFSGLNVFEKFYIPTEILPPGYFDKLAFLVRGVRHNIDASGWKTNVESLAVDAFKIAHSDDQKTPSPSSEAPPTPPTTPPNP